MAHTPSSRSTQVLYSVVFGLLITSACFAEESASSVFLDSTKSIEQRLKSMESIKPRELQASLEQLIAILDDTKLPDEIRSFCASEINFGNSIINPENQTKINLIASNICKDPTNGGEKLKLQILQWVNSRHTFTPRNGLPTISPADMKQLLASENPQIRELSIKLIIENDITFAQELEDALNGKPHGNVTMLESLNGLSRIPTDQINHRAITPLLKHESNEVRIKSAELLARNYEHETLMASITDPNLSTEFKTATIEAITRSIIHNNELYIFSNKLIQIVEDKNTTPEMRKSALSNLHDLIKDSPAETLSKDVTESLYNLHQSYLKHDPEGIAFEKIDRENLPKWAESIENIYAQIILKYSHIKEIREAKRLIAEQNEIKKMINILHDKSQSPLVRHQMLTTIGRKPEEAARFAVDPENDEKMRVRAIESLLDGIYQKQNELNPELERFAKVVKQVSEEKTDSPTKSRAIQFKDSIRNQYPIIYTKIFPADK